MRLAGLRPAGNGGGVTPTPNPLVFQIEGPSDWPSLILAPDGVMRMPVLNGSTYFVHGTFPVPRLFRVPTEVNVDFQLTQFISAVSTQILLCDGDETPHIWGRDISGIEFRNITLADISNSGAGRGTNLYDLVGGTALSFLVHRFSSIANFKSVGKLVDIGLATELFSMVENEAGLLTFYSGVELSVGVTNTQLLLSQLDAGSPMKKPAWCLMGDIGKAQFATGTVANSANDSAFCIDSLVTGEVEFVGNLFQSGDGNFFRPDVSLGLTLMEEVDKSITSFTAHAHPVVSVSAGSSGTNFSTGTVRHQFQVGDTITLTGFSEGSYNATEDVTEVISPFIVRIKAISFVADDSGTATNTGVTVCASAGAGFTRGQTILLGGATPGAYSGGQTIRSVDPDEDSFLIPVSFSVGGAGDIKITRITTATDHPMAVGETQTISVTTSYNFTTQILFTDAYDTFDVPIAFVGDDATGTVVSVSKTQRDIGVQGAINGILPDSKAIAFGRTNGNATATTGFSSNTYKAINVSGMVDGDVTERFTLTDTTAGIYTYIGEKPISARIAAVISATKGNPTEIYRFAASVNSAVPTFATAPFSKMEVKTTTVTIPDAGFVNMETGDTIQIMAAPEGHTDDLTISDFTIEITG